MMTNSFRNRIEVPTDMTAGELRIQNDEFCIQNDESLIKYEQCFQVIMCSAGGGMQK